MGWSGGNCIFDEVADALIEQGASPTLKQNVLARLIGVLLDGDWDDEHESLARYRADPAIVAAFRTHGVVEPCGEPVPGAPAGGCRLEIGHDGAEHEGLHCRWDAGTEALAVEVAATLSGARVPGSYTPGAYSTTPGFQVCASSRAGAVVVRNFEKEGERSPFPRRHPTLGHYLTAAQEFDLERRERNARGRAACAGYARILAEAGWDVEISDGPPPHLLVSRRLEVTGG